MKLSLENTCLELGINLKRECDLNRVILKTSKSSTINYPVSGFNCTGYFVALPSLQHPMIGFALDIDVNDLIPIILHEWSHMDQWVENSKVWNDNIHKIGDEYKESVDIIDEWINGANIDNIDFYIKKAMEVELDCEMRTIKKMYQFGLENSLKFSIDEYIQKANSYIFLYHYVRQKRSWNITGKAPYMLESVWKKFPTNFDQDYSILKPEYIELYSRYCYK